MKSKQWVIHRANGYNEFVLYYFVDVAMACSFAENVRIMRMFEINTDGTISLFL